MVKKQNVLKDAVAVLDNFSGALSGEKRQMVVGIVSGLMAAGYGFDKALKEVCWAAKTKSKPLGKEEFKQYLPESWKEKADKFWEKTK